MIEHIQKLSPQAILLGLPDVLRRCSNLIASLSHEWLPIEDAPTDGTVIRLYDPEIYDEEFNFYCDGHWTDIMEDDKPKWQGPVWDNEQGCFITKRINPTHYMPLPNPPERIKGKVLVRPDGSPVYD